MANCKKQKETATGQALEVSPETHLTGVHRVPHKPSAVWDRGLSVSRGEKYMGHPQEKPLRQKFPVEGTQ